MVLLSDSARFVANPDVIATDLEQEMVLLDRETQEMFRLNRTGREVWLGLAATDLAGLARRLAEAFAVSREQAGQDVRAVLATLLEAGLIARAADGG